MVQHVNRKIFTPWPEVSSTVKQELAAVLKKHGLEVYLPAGFNTSPGVLSLEDDPEFAKMEERAKGFTESARQTKPIEGDQ